MKKVFEADIPRDVTRSGFDAVRFEDGGQAMIIELGNEDEGEMFVRVQSWSDDRSHADAKQLLGQRVRVTVETITTPTPKE